MFTKLAALVLLLACFDDANGHGRLLEPPSRASMWRVGFNTPRDYNDNQLFCGGFYNQWQVHGGRCGVCGDPWQGPRDHEAGGKYAPGVIGRRYAIGQTVDIQIEVTANHLGWFEFRLCPNNDAKKPVTQECLDKHVLQMADGSGTKHFIGSATGMYNLKVKLPDDVSCSQCMLQWKWHTGNSYGIGADGRMCKGCGDQEEFYGCADVAIGYTQFPQRPIRPQIGIGVRPTLRPYQPIITQRPQVYQTHRPIVTQRPNPHYISQPIKSETCKAINNWAGNPELDKWCVVNCGKGYCPVFMCRCR